MNRRRGPGSRHFPNPINPDSLNPKPTSSTSPAEVTALSKWVLRRDFVQQPSRRAELVEACKGNHVRPEAVWLVLWVLADRANPYSGEVDSTLDQIANEAPTNRATAKRAVHVLRNLGWLVEVQGHRPPGRRGGRGTTYRLPFLTPHTPSTFDANAVPPGTPLLTNAVPPGTPFDQHNDMNAVPHEPLGVPPGTPLVTPSKKRTLHEALRQRTSEVISTAQESSTISKARLDASARALWHSECTPEAFWLRCGEIGDLTAVLIAHANDTTAPTEIVERLDLAVRSHTGDSPALLTTNPTAPNNENANQ